ncbi:MAG: hypothetical protein EXR48_03280 [Dehalococcoidia bacterium]|nr:hypothetical protein [Dehalococcoidia bacterium]
MRTLLTCPFSLLTSRRPALLLAVLAVALVAVACQGNSGPDARSKVINVLTSGIARNTVPAGEEYLRQWGLSAVSAATRVKNQEGRQYEVKFRVLPYTPSTEETWMVDMEHGAFQPVDANALRSATQLVCEGRAGPFPDCPAFFAQLDGLPGGSGG